MVNIDLEEIKLIRENSRSWRAEERPLPDLVAGNQIRILSLQVIQGPDGLFRPEPGHPRRRVTVIIGPSGTGKSVLMKHILGLIKPDSGSILIDGRDVTTMKEVDLKDVQEGVRGLLSGCCALRLHDRRRKRSVSLTIHTRLSKDEIKREVARLLRDVGLSGIEEKMPSQLSGG